MTTIEKQKQAKRMFRALRARGFSFRLNEAGGVVVDGEGVETALFAETLDRLQDFSLELGAEVAEALGMERALEDHGGLRSAVVAHELLARDPGNRAALRCLAGEDPGAEIFHRLSAIGLRVEPDFEQAVINGTDEISLRINGDAEVLNEVVDEGMRAQLRLHREGVIAEYFRQGARASDVDSVLSEAYCKASASAQTTPAPASKCLVMTIESKNFGLDCANGTCPNVVPPNCLNSCGRCRNWARRWTTRVHGTPRQKSNASSTSRIRTQAKRFECTCRPMGSGCG